MRTSSSIPKHLQSLRLGRAPWLLALAVLVLVGVLVLLGWLLLNRDTEPTPKLIEGEGVQLTVPGDWKEEDFSQNEACQTETLICVAILTAPEGYNFSISWYPQFTENTVQAVDESEWKKFREYYPNAILLSRQDLEVGGLPAIERTFLQNDQQNTPIYFRQVYILNGYQLYLVTARFFSAEMLETQEEVVDAVIESIQFIPIPK